MNSALVHEKQKPWSCLGSLSWHKENLPGKVLGLSPMQRWCQEICFLWIDGQACIELGQSCRSWWNASKLVWCLCLCCSDLWLRLIWAYSWWSDGVSWSCLSSSPLVWSAVQFLYSKDFLIQLLPCFGERLHWWVGWWPMHCQWLLLLLLLCLLLLLRSKWCIAGVNCCRKLQFWCCWG